MASLISMAEAANEASSYYPCEKALPNAQVYQLWGLNPDDCGQIQRNGKDGWCGVEKNVILTFEQ